VVLIGVRDIDAAEKENIRRAGITEVYTLRAIDEHNRTADLAVELISSAFGKKIL
jgi:arginase